MMPGIDIKQKNYWLFFKEKANAEETLEMVDWLGSCINCRVCRSLCRHVAGKKATE
jgi:succinate dehydrogenase/fumarate reductase-like Fe-S protein